MRNLNVDAPYLSAQPTPGLPMLGVRQDIAATLAGTNGDWTAPIFDASGRLYVSSVIGLDGTGTAGTVALSPVNTWVQVPPSGSVPSAAYTLVVKSEERTGIVRWAFANASAPSATYGLQLEAVDSLILDLAGGDFVYLGSTAATDDVNWTVKIVV